MTADSTLSAAVGPPYPSRHEEQYPSPTDASTLGDGLSPTPYYLDHRGSADAQHDSLEEDVQNAGDGGDG